MQRIVHHTARSCVVAGLLACVADGATAPLPAPVHSITVTPPVDSGTIGEVVPFIAVLRDSQGAVLTGRAVTWTSRAPAVATVSAASGVATYHAPGLARIVATSEGVSDSARIVVVGPPPQSGFFAAPGGSGAGDGSAQRPWDLATALAGGGGRVRPGDTIWLVGGTYRGAFVSTVAGASGAPVVIRPLPGARAVIDGAGAGASTLNVDGDWVVLWGLEVMNSDPARTTSSTANDWRHNSIVNYASHTRYLNLVVHDGGVAFYTSPNETDVEIGGSIFFNNGWQGPDRGHGHGLYLKSFGGPVVARDNVVFNQFGYGIHAYTTQGSGRLVGIQLERNTLFNNGTVSSNSSASNILLGGDDYADAARVTRNIAYFSSGAGASNGRFGYGSLLNGDLRVEDNRFIGGDPVMHMGHWTTATVARNGFVGDGRIARLDDIVTVGESWSGNLHYRDAAAAAWTLAGVDYLFAAWQLVTGLAGTDQAIAARPTATQVDVLLNPYEPGRAHIVVVNWGRLSAVTVDPTGVVPAGSRYEIRNVQNLFGAPVVSGTYSGGAVTLPLAAVPPPVPIGMSTSPAPSTGTDFLVFLLTVTP